MPVLLLSVALLALVACAPDAGERDGSRAVPIDALFDYQLGGAYESADDVEVLVRDRAATPAEGRYNVCYVNGFQTQPGERAVWEAAEGGSAPELLLRDATGDVVADPGWPDEFLLDTSTAEARDRILEVVGPWIDGCAQDGFDAVEIDNLDSFLRSDAALTIDDNLALAQDFSARAHAAGLQIAQKNAPELSAALREVGYDFAIAESCLQFEECESYTEVYDVVLAVEYTDELGEDAFLAACEGTERPASLVLRDPLLLTPDDGGHVFRACDAAGS